MARMKHAVFLALALVVSGCASTATYAPAKSPGALGYASQQIETGRHVVSFTDADPARARNLALLRAAEITLTEGRDWFEVTNAYAEPASARRSGGPSISVGGGVASGGRSSVGLGVGLGFPLGGASGGSGRVTEVIEIVTGAGPKPDRPSAYDARSVDINLRSQAF